MRQARNVVGERPQRRHFSGRNGREGLESTPFDRCKCVVAANPALACGHCSGATEYALEPCAAFRLSGHYISKRSPSSFIQPSRAQDFSQMIHGKISCKDTKEIIGNTATSALRSSWAHRQQFRRVLTGFWLGAFNLRVMNADGRRKAKMYIRRVRCRGPCH